MFKTMTKLAIIMYFEPDIQAEVVFCCLCQKKCVYSEIIDLCMVNDNIESRFIKISNDVISLVIGLMYRPPNSNIIQFTENWNDILGQVPHMPCYVMGDYNIGFLKHCLHPPTEHFLEGMYSNSLLPMIFKPTRETATTASFIDNVFTNKYSINDDIELNNDSARP